MELLKENAFDILLLDINLPDVDGLVACTQIRQFYSDIKIICLTSSNDPFTIAQFLRNGGNGYLLKSMKRIDLLNAIDKVLQVKIYLSSDANEALLKQFTNLQEALAPKPVLTRRETEILQLLGDGFTGPQIADELFISSHTVESHRKNLLQKLKATHTMMLLKAAR